MSKRDVFTVDGVDQHRNTAILYGAFRSGGRMCFEIVLTASQAWRCQDEVAASPAQALAMALDGSELHFADSWLEPLPVLDSVRTWWALHWDGEQIQARTVYRDELDQFRETCRAAARDLKAIAATYSADGLPLGSVAPGQVCMAPEDYQPVLGTAEQWESVREQQHVTELPGRGPDTEYWVSAFHEIWD